jgi:hypothetical protein
VKKATLVLAAVHLLQATWLLHAGIDLLLVHAPAAASAGAADACCSTRCGCPQELRDRGDCCCPDAGASGAARGGTPSAFEAARCRGVEAALAQAATQPALCDFAQVERPVPAAELLSPAPFVSQELPETSPPDKVPL